MKPLCPLVPALLYAALSLGANPATAQVLSEAQRAEVSQMRAGDMRKLVIHATPEPAPDTVFTDKAGAERTLAESNGKLRLVNFWATWCAPCRTEKPALDALETERGGPDFAVIAIATGRNKLKDIERFNAEVGISALETNLDPEGTLARAMGIPGLPVTVILNREGDEIARVMGGADWSSPEAGAILDYLGALPG